MRNPRDIQNQRWIQNLTFANDNLIKSMAKKTRRKTALKWPVTLVTADSEVAKLNECYVGAKRSQSDIWKSDSSKIQVAADVIVRPRT